MMRVLLMVLALACFLACGSSTDDTGEAAEAGETVGPAVLEVGEDEDEEGDEGEEGEGEPELPPEGALPLSGIVASLEAQGLIPILEIEFEEGVWDIDCLMKGEEWEVEVDPLNGAILSSQAETEEEEGEAGEEEMEDDEEEGAQELPPEGALPLSGIIAALEAEGYGPILEVEFEGGVWDVDCLLKGEEWEVEFDPLNGKIRVSGAE